jgi:spermidine/putrescine transport system substrate-binding protein
MNALKKMCLAVCFSLCILNLYPVSQVFAEELRMLTFKGTDPPEALEAFKVLVKEKYGVDLNIAVSYVSEHGDFYNALRNKETDIINCPHNLPKDPRYKFISGKLVIPIDLNNIPNYKDLIPSFQKADYITENGEVYGVPFTCAPYGMAYNTNKLQDPPATWNVFWDPQYKGKYSVSSDMYELNIFITALSMGIDKSKLADYKSVYSPEFLDRLRYLAQNVKSFWGGVDTADNLQGTALATAWGFSFAELKKKGEIWEFANPKEGTPGGVGNYMISHTLRNQPKLRRIAEEWLNYVISPDFQVNIVARKLSTAIVNLSVRDQLTPEETASFHLDDPNYFQERLIPYPVLDNQSRKGFELLWKKARE